MTAIISAIGAALLGYKSKKDGDKSDDRTNALADSQLNITNSLKQTDVGVKDIAVSMDVLVQKLKQHPELEKLLSETKDTGLDDKSVLEFIKEQRKGWDEDIRNYYHTSSFNEDEIKKDGVLNKTAIVDKQTTPK